MPEPTQLLFALLGLGLLGFGGDLLVRGAVGIAATLGVSPLFTGLVLVGFGTSTPELATSVDAALRGSPGIAAGNVIGSNIANILLILGVTALILPIPAEPRSFRRDAPVLALATLAACAAVLWGGVGRLQGLAFLAMLAAYLGWTYRLERRRQDEPAQLHAEEGALLQAPGRTLRSALVLAVGGFAAILVGADLLVDASIGIASALGIPESVIGLTVIAVGTSLPELATSIVAALRRQTDIALGNVIGSNIFNVLGILGATAVVVPMEFGATPLATDAWILLGVTALLLLFALSRARIVRLEGAAFLALYAGYLAFQLTRVP
jgi:cation:H+ antiporter